MTEKNMMLPLSKLTKEELLWLRYWGNDESIDEEPINILALRTRREVQKTLKGWGFDTRDDDKRMREKILKAIESCA